MTAPISPEDLADLQTAVEEDDDLRSSIYVHDVVKLLASHAWHRARVQVTDEDIARVGLEGQHAQLLKWCESNGVDAGAGLYRGRRVWREGSLQEWAINHFAKLCNRAPLDVLDEIAAAGRWTWRLQGCAIADHRGRDGLEFDGVQLRAKYGMPGEVDGCMCVAVPFR